MKQKNRAKAGIMMRESYEIWAKVGIAVVLSEFFSAEQIIYHQHSLSQKRHIQKETITGKIVSEKCIWR